MNICRDIVAMVTISSPSKAPSRPTFNPQRCKGKEIERDGEILGGGGGGGGGLVNVHVLKLYLCKKHTHTHTQTRTVT